MTSTSINNFFSIANTKIKLIEEVRQHFGRETSPRFNSFDFWWIDENKVSEILAFFLNPNENHEQGDIYLKHFLNRYGLKHLTYSNHCEVRVQCELPTDDGRFIDIVVYKKSFEWAVGIENKINLSTADQYGQLIDYNNFLKQTTNNNYCLIYLAPKDKIIAPSSMSSAMQGELKEQNRFMHLTYEEHLIGCISEFAMMTESIRVRSFLKDFEKTLRKRYMGEKDMEAKETIVDLMKESSDNIKVACLVYNSWGDMKEKLEEVFKNQLKELAIDPALNLELLDHDGLDDTRAWLKPKNWKGHYFGYEFEANYVFFGMKCEVYSIDKEKYSEHIDYVNGRLSGGFDFSGWWPIYKYFPMHLSNSADFWIAVKDGTAKEEIRKFIQLMVEKYETDDAFFLK